jgi:hypothetical protein
MIARDALIIAAPEGVQIIPVLVSERFRHVLSEIICRTFDGLRRLGRVDGERGRRDGKSFVNEDFCSRRMIDDHEREMIVVISLPEFSRHA